MSDHENLTVIRRWSDEEGHEKDQWGDWIWPPPPEYIESRANGNLRDDILRRLGRDVDDEGVTVRLIEGEIEGGYSEYTVEIDYGIEVWIDEDRQSQKVFDSDLHYSTERAFEALMKWIEARA